LKIKNFLKDIIIIKEIFLLNEGGGGGGGGGGKDVLLHQKTPQDKKCLQFLHKQLTLK
jgi:hypothetical protein